MADSSLVLPWYNNAEKRFDDVPKLTAKQARDLRVKVRDGMSNLRISSKRLNTLMQRYEAVIQKNWLMRSKSKRRSILRHVWPDIRTARIRIFEASRQRYDTDEPNTDERLRKHILSPEINLEQLETDHNLLLFLNSRGRHNPEIFVQRDIGTDFSRNWIKAVNHPPKVLGYTIALGGHDIVRYGRLVEWTSRPNDGYSIYRHGLGCLPAEGLLTIELQQRTLDFLLGCCEEILSAKELEDDTVQKEPPALPRDNGSWDLLKATAPYLVPEKMNLPRLSKLVHGRITRFEDHLFSLHENPQYFADWLSDEINHKKNPSKYVGADYVALGHLDRLLIKALSTTYESLLCWRELLRCINVMHELQEEYKSQLHVMKPLPKKLCKEVKATVYLLQFMSHQHAFKAAKSSAASDPVRARATETGGDDDELTVVLSWITQMLGQDIRNPCVGEALPAFELPNTLLQPVLDDLEYIATKDQKQAGRFTAFVIDQWTNSFLLSEIASQVVRGYTPWLNPIWWNVDQSQLARDVEAVLEPTAIFAESLCAPSGLNVAEPGDKRYKYPIHEERSAENVAILQTSERYLDSLWLQIECEPDAKAALDIIYPIQQGDLQRTPDWGKPHDVKFKKEQQLKSEEARGPGESAPTSPPRRRRRKVKKRGKPDTPESPLVDEPEQEAAAPPTLDAPGVMHVDRRSYNVFSTLFHMPNERNKSGDIAWTEFLYAMRSVGFGWQRLAGSAWEFTELSTDRSIQFHQPHPSPRVTFEVIKIIGKRLHKKFGWTGQMFALKA